MAGPWSPWKVFARPGSKTYESQSSAVLPFGEGALYLGDRWCPTNLAQSSYIWLPLEMDGHVVKMEDRRCWILDTSNASWKDAMSEYYCENYSTVPGTSFSCRLKSAGATRTTMRVRYTNEATTSLQGIATTNGASQKIDFLPTGYGKQGVQELGETVVHCDLAPDQENVFSLKDLNVSVRVLGVAASLD